MSKSGWASVSWPEIDFLTKGFGLAVDLAAPRNQVTGAAGRLASPHPAGGRCFVPLSGGYVCCSSARAPPSQPPTRVMVSGTGFDEVHAGHRQRDWRPPKEPAAVIALGGLKVRIRKPVWSLEALSSLTVDRALPKLSM